MNKQRRQIVFAALVFVSIAAILLLSYIVSRPDISFDVRDRAAEGDVEIASEMLWNGERIGVSVWQENGSPFALRVGLHHDDQYDSEEFETEYSIIFPTDLGYDNWLFIYESPVLQPSEGKYWVTLRACMDDECSIFPTTPPTYSQEYEVLEPAGEIQVTDSSFCEYGYVHIDGVNATRDLFKYEVTDANNDIVYLEYHDRWTLCEAPERDNLFSKLTTPAHACSPEPWYPDIGQEYRIRLYSCHDYADDGSLEFVGCDTLLDEMQYTASSCVVPEVDVGVDAINIPMTPVVGETFPIDVIVKNYSAATSGPFKVVGEIWTNPAPTCIDCYLKRFEYTVEDGLPGGGTHTVDYDVEGLGEGDYFVYVKIQYIETSTPISTDPNSENNSDSRNFSVYLAEPICGLECPEGQILTDECECVECLIDSDCPRTTEVCNKNNVCVCNNDLCPSGKIMNSNCTVCICPDQCPKGYVQAQNCGCYKDCVNCKDRRLFEECEDKEILMPNGECEEVECVTDSDCGGVEECDGASHTCVCTLSCGQGLAATDACSECVCDSSCDTGQIRRSDCSCVVSEVEIPVRQDPAKVELSISDSVSAGSYVAGDKISLTYSIAGKYDVKPELVTWTVEDEEVGTGNGFVYSFSQSGKKTVQLYYAGELMDSVEVMVIGNAVTAELPADGPFDTEWWNSWVAVIILMAMVAVVLFALRMIFQVSRRR